MKNVTVSLDDATYRRARLKASEMDTSLSALVRDYLAKLGADETEFERLKRMEHELRQRIGIGSAGDRLSRDELYERKRTREEVPRAEDDGHR